MRGCFVTGTDTGVGKTVLASAIAAALRAAGTSVAAFKPVVTGLAEPEPGRPADHELLGAAAGGTPDAVAPLRFDPPVSPHLAAELAGAPIDPAAVLAAARAAARAEALVVEGVGGLLVPIAPEWTVRDLAADLGLPVVVAARPGLGTISHSLLTVEGARAAGLDVRAVVLTPWPATPTAMHRSNRETIARLGAVAVETLPPVGTDPAELARAGAALPVGAWIGPPAPLQAPRERGGAGGAPPAPTLRGERVVLRPATSADAAAVGGVLAAPEVARWWDAADVAAVLDDPDTTTWIVLVDGAVAGLVQAWEEADPDYRHAGIDIALHPGFHGRGLGAETVRTVARHLFADRGHHRVTIDPAAANARAIRSYERIGFRPVGVLRSYERDPDGGWRDGLLMDLLAGELR
jgi:dethiobiotin synthetase